MAKVTRARTRRAGTTRRSFLVSTAGTLALAAGHGTFPRRAFAQAKLEKDELKFGFIKLTDCAPLLIAKEKGFFEDEGLFVTLEAQANWKVLLDRVIDGELDGAHMLAGQAIGATIGFGTKADVVTAVRHGPQQLAVTVSNEVWAEMKKTVPHAGRQARAPDQGRCAEGGGRAVQGRRQQVQHGHGVPDLDPQLRAALLAGRRRPASGLLFRRTTSPARSAPTC